MARMQVASGKAKRKPAKKAAKRKAAKKAAKKAATRKPAKKAAKRKAAKKPAKRKARKRPVASGYTRKRGGKLLVPRTPPGDDDEGDLVAPSKLAMGVRSAKQEVRDVIEELADFADGFDVSEVALEVSFSADGKFLGVGVGGATSLGLKLVPSDERGDR